MGPAPGVGASDARAILGRALMADPQTDDERLVVAFFTVLSSGDLERLRGLLTPDASWTAMVRGVPGAGAHHGRDTVIDEFLAPVRGLFAPGDPKVEIRSLVSRPGFVMAETVATGRLNDGRIYDNRYAWAIETEGGKVKALREYMDSHYIVSLFAG